MALPSCLFSLISWVYLDTSSVLLYSSWNAPLPLLTSMDAQIRASVPPGTMKIRLQDLILGKKRDITYLYLL